MVVSLTPSCVGCVIVYSSWVICTLSIFCLFVHPVAVTSYSKISEGVAKGVVSALSPWYPHSVS